ncbi:WAP domain containing protein, SLPI-like [Trichuris trichiura]|uniref:WAP domain containing protein, SLPI-like n=1 Tax=Trichuris trichiura TaxID=36087 RepID=A0A077Z8E0_TRITR|nr:WAP domain containing protein, SLPI-like [Trichuris trichiura]
MSNCSSPPSSANTNSATELRRINPVNMRLDVGSPLRTMTIQWFYISLAILALFNLPAGEGRKIGLCPKLLLKVADDAIDRCDRDENCEGRKICCPTIRGRICMAPIETRAFGGNELCPPYLGSKKSDAIDRCHTDSDCPQGRYCCDSLSGYVCMKPEPAAQERSQGVCPKLSADRKPDAIDRCRTDTDCSSQYICCETVAGNVCMHPETLQPTGEFPTIANNSLPLQESSLKYFKNIKCLPTANGQPNILFSFVY